jgi:prolyl oligopeptidase
MVPVFVFHKRESNWTAKRADDAHRLRRLQREPDSRPGARYLWLEHGGVYAVANLRGGSIWRDGIAPCWTEANVFDDFIAAAEFLISDKITDKAPGHQGARMAACDGRGAASVLTCFAPSSPVPLLDMLRYQNFLIAKFWVPEYGSAEDAKQFDWLYAYSPYQHVKPGTEYPAIMFMTADSDSRVDPMHAKKMAALMQAQAANGKSKERPILLD